MESTAQSTMKQSATVLLVVLPMLVACGSPSFSDQNDLYLATLWVQTAPEYRASTIQAYATARERLIQGLDDSAWTADLSQAQSDGYRSLPPAIVLDIDETILDNSPYEARLVEDDSLFDGDSWLQWVAEEQAGAVPGALSFTQWASAEGVTVFYVSNRDAGMESATRSNLDALGFPLSDSLDTVFLRGEEQAWTDSDKTPRRARIAESFRILLLVGDALGDFVEPEPGADTSLFDDQWGRTWIALPNPMYGSWARSATADADRAGKVSFLTTKRPR